MCSSLTLKLLALAILLFSVFTVAAQTPAASTAQDVSETHLYRARDYVTDGNPRAEQEFRLAIAARAGNYPEAWQELGRYLQRKQKFAEAAVAWRKHLQQTSDQKYPNSFDIVRNLRRAADLKQRWESGRRFSADEALEFLKLVDGIAERGDAIPYAERAVEFYPDSPKILIALADLLRWEDKERSLRLLDRAVSLAPKDASVYLSRGWGRFWLSNPGDAESDFRRALKLTDNANASAWAGLGEVLAHQGRRDEAIHAYRTSLAIRPASMSHYDGEIRKSIELLKRVPAQP